MKRMADILSINSDKYQKNYTTLFLLKVVDNN